MLQVRLPMPEAGAERDAMFFRHHNCKNAKTFRSALEDPDVDLLEFAVGFHGGGVPANTPFVVTATNPCDVCGSLPSIWVTWHAPLILL